MSSVPPESIPEMYIRGSTIQLDSPLEPLDPELLQTLGNLRALSKVEPIPTRVWKHELSEREREALGGDMIAAMHTYASPVNLLLAVRPIWILDAILKVAAIADLLAESVVYSYQEQLRKVDPVRRHLAPDLPRTQSDEGTDIDYDDLAQDAAKRFRLVLVVGSLCREVCWDGAWLRVDWFKHGVTWQFFSELVRHRAEKQPLTADVFARATSRTMVNWKSRLLSHVPPALGEIIDAHGDGTYYLRLSEDSIRVIDVRDGSRLNFLDFAERRDAARVAASPGTSQATSTGASNPLSIERAAMGEAPTSQPDPPCPAVDTQASETST